MLVIVGYFHFFVEKGRRILKKKLLILTATLALVGCSEQEAEKPTPVPVVSEVEEVVDNATYSPFTGKEIEDTKQFFSVMIENSPNARPQTGLSSADIVYEIKTEGNISRYLAFFHDEIPKTIGPVRSSRHYFISLAEELNSPYIHFGASTYAYKYLRSNLIEIPHIDGITEAQYFFRDQTRKAPHNAYLKTDSLDDFSKNEPKNDHVVFGENATEKGIETLNMEYSYNASTDIKYVYNEQEKVYLRFQEGVPHIDRETEEQLKVKNVLFQYTEHEAIEDDKYGRIDVHLVGEGKIVYVSEGKRVEGTWKKENDNTSTIYYDEEGNILKLNRGNTWIQVVETNALVYMNK